MRIKGRYRSMKYLTLTGLFSKGQMFYLQEQFGRWYLEYLLEYMYMNCIAAGRNWIPFQPEFYDPNQHKNVERVVLNNNYSLRY